MLKIQGLELALNLIRRAETEWLKQIRLRTALKDSASFYSGF
jgi:hypothetical protein